MATVVGMDVIHDIVRCAFTISQTFMDELPDLPAAHHLALMELDAVLAPMYLENHLNGDD